VVIRFELRSGRRVLASGCGAILILCLAVALLGLLQGPVAPDVAERAIRQHFASQLAGKHMAELGSAGLRMPTQAMASRWKQEYDRQRLLSVREVEVASSRIWFLDRSPVHYTRATVALDREPPRTRYFRLSYGGALVSECSVWGWWLRW
jgi:hypothetical protein